MVHDPGSLLTSVILGVIEGITEFIPVSSTGHLILAGHYLNFKGEFASTFEIFIQLGAILAVVVLYWKRFIGLLIFKDGSSLEEGFRGMAGISKLAIGCLPAFVLGFLFHDTIKIYLFAPVTVAFALIVGGFAMIVVERLNLKTEAQNLEEITLRQSLVTGLFQCFALWPGMSRSGSTIVGGMMGGMGRRTAAEFSFILAVPVMIAAVGYDLLKSASGLNVSDFPFFAVGFLVSFVAAAAAIKLFIRILQTYTLRAFGYYRIVGGIVYLCLIDIGVI